MKIRVLVLMLFVFSTHCAIALEMSEAEESVWEMEENYWRYVQAGDVESYLTLWHEDFVGWPCSTWEPADKTNVANWVRNIRDKEWRLTYELKPLAIRLFGDIAVVHYAATYVFDYGDGTGAGEGEPRKFTHTWMKVDGQWQIITGMCANQKPARTAR
jgi:ketosteroid isomerase-like protein